MTHRTKLVFIDNYQILIVILDSFLILISKLLNANAHSSQDLSYKPDYKDCPKY